MVRRTRTVDERFGCTQLAMKFEKKKTAAVGNHRCLASLCPAQALRTRLCCRVTQPSAYAVNKELEDQILFGDGT